MNAEALDHLSRLASAALVDAAAREREAERLRSIYYDRAVALAELVASAAPDLDRAATLYIVARDEWADAADRAALAHERRDHAFRDYHIARSELAAAVKRRAAATGKEAAK